MTELLPCPFCPDGGKPELVGFGKQNAKYFFGMAEMTKRVVCTECCSSSGLFDNEAKAIRAWNTRHDEEQAKANQERLAQIGEAVVKKEPIHFLAGETYVPERTCRNTSGIVFECSECGQQTDPLEVANLNFCPNCGARIEGD